jgi:hypothetical protein
MYLSCTISATATKCSPVFAQGTKTSHLPSTPMPIQMYWSIPVRSTDVSGSPPHQPEPQCPTFQLTAMRYHFAASFMSFLIPLEPFDNKKPSSVMRDASQRLGLSHIGMSGRMIWGSDAHTPSRKQLAISNSPTDRSFCIDPSVSQSPSPYKLGRHDTRGAHSQS